ncbi:hypothetical protein NHQ30_001261 [Ciborinia camelliae]|nr:hypothetical protein NHQ30_001261 [Ciborinia camelliae]
MGVHILGIMVDEYATIDPLSNWQDLETLVNQYHRPPKSDSLSASQSEASNGEILESIDRPPKFICCHRDLSVSFDSRWNSFMYAMAQGNILHKPPHAHAPERLRSLMRQTEFIIRVSSPYVDIFLVQSLDEYGTFVEIDRQIHEEDAEELPEWLRGIFVPEFERALEWTCRDHSNRFRCTPFLRKSMGSSWW